MRRRPLCLVAILLLLILWMLPEDVWFQTPDIPSGEKVLLTGIVSKREQTEERTAYVLKNCQCDKSNSTFSVLAYTQKGTSYPIGCELSIFGTIYQVNQADNPGQFDSRSYYQSQGILYTFFVDTISYAEGESFFLEKMTSFREYFAKSLELVFDEEDAGILKAVLLGDKSTLSEETQLLYQKCGISHLLAISGLHISMIGISMYRLLRKCRCTFLEAGLPSGCLLLAYGFMTGFGISTIRAICMFLVMILADILGRVYDMASATALAAILILLRNPLQARSAGFLLSFGAILGICFVYPILESIISPKKPWAKTILFSCSLSFITYPLTIHFFYEYALYSLLLNFIVIPCMPVVMASGGLAMFMGSIYPRGGIILGLPAHWVLSFYKVLCRWNLSIPGAVLRLGREETWQLILYYGIIVLALLGLWYGRRKIYGVLLPVAILLVSIRLSPGLQFTMLDVGQGDCLYLELSDGTCCLIDGGSTSIKEVGTYRILPYLKYEGVQTLDYVILTHLDEDHVNGVRELIEMKGTLDGVEIQNILFPEIANPDETYQELVELAESKDILVKTIGAGDVIAGADYLLECLYPVKGTWTANENNDSTVLQLTYKDFSMLLTGDMGFEGEKDLLRQGSLKDVDVWKVSHHGSKYAGSRAFLQNIRPALGLISVGRNYYGHPSDEVLERLSQVGCEVYTTLERGALLLESDGERFSLESAR